MSRDSVQRPSESVPNGNAASPPLAQAGGRKRFEVKAATVGEALRDSAQALEVASETAQAWLNRYVAAWQTFDREDIAGLLEVITTACDVARATPRQETVFAYWRRMYEAMSAWTTGCRRLWKTAYASTG